MPIRLNKPGKWCRGGSEELEVRMGGLVWRGEIGKLG